LYEANVDYHESDFLFWQGKSYLKPLRMQNAPEIFPPSRGILFAMDGQESLLVYVVRLLLIFGVLRGRFVSTIVGRETGFAGSFLINAGIIVLMLWLARVWKDTKRSHPGLVRPALAVFGAVSVVVFLLR